MEALCIFYKTPGADEVLDGHCARPLGVTSDTGLQYAGVLMLEGGRIGQQHGLQPLVAWRYTARQGGLMKHHYQLNVKWTGNRGSGTSGYRDYDRDHVISAPGKPAIPGSSDPAFRGDAARWNPEELLVASASACHKLWYLHLCADAGIVVSAYEDDAEGTMLDERFERIVLRPRVTIATGDHELARQLHHTAHEKCYIANSVNFPILCEPVIM